MRKVIAVSLFAGLATWVAARSGLLDRLRPGWGKRQRLRGTWNQLEVKGKQAVGHAANDHPLAAEGLVEEALGAVRRGVGRAVDSL